MSDNAKAFSSAKKIQEGFNALAGQQKAVLQKLLGQAAIAQASLGVRMSRTPYGEPFAALTSRVGKPLRRTGNNIQRSWTAGQETPTTFVFGSRFKWLATHQYGAVIRPVRAKALRFHIEMGGDAVYGFVRRKVKGTGKKFGNKARFQEGFDQVGTTGTDIVVQKVTIPRRQMIPEKDTGGLGTRWTNAFKRTARGYLERVFLSKAA